METENVPILEITPVIRGGFVVNLQVGRMREPLALRKPLDISQLPTLYNLLEEINRYIDFQGQSGWTIDEVYPFFCDYISEKSLEFFRLIAENDDWTPRDEILKNMNVGGRTLAGILSSPGQFFARYRKEPLYEKSDRTDKNNKLQRYYRIHPNFREMVRDALDIKSVTE